MRKKLWYYAMAAFMGFAFVACNDEDEDEFEVASDAYYINQVIEGQTRTAVAYYVYANQPVSSAKVNLPGGGSKVLDDSYNLSYTWLNEPDTADYVVGYPAQGTYQFETTSKSGITLNSSDVLDPDTLAIPVIKSQQYSSTSFSYTVKWDKVPKADAYVLKIVDPGQGVVYSSYTLNKNAVSYTISSSGSGYWNASPSNGKTYTFQLQAFIFENGAEDPDYIYNIQETSIGSKPVVWGQ